MEEHPVYSNFADLLLTKEGFSSEHSTPRHERGDYGCVFISHPLPTDLLCRVCGLVLRDPFQTQCCGNHYCGYCLVLQLAVRSECAFCSARQVRAFRDVNVTRRVNRLRIKCPHSERGCVWEGELYDVGHHLYRCSSSPRVCRTCGGVFPQDRILEHEQKHCEWRRYRCQYCKKFISTYARVRDFHWPKCGHYRILCPNGCSQCIIPRRDMESHLRNDCDVKIKLIEMSELVRDLKSQLKRKNSEIEDLKLQVLAKEKTARDTQSLLETNNEELVQRVTETQQKKAELEHENLCLSQDLTERDKKIKDLLCKNRHLRKSLTQMEEDTGVQLKAMKEICQSLKEEKEELERRALEANTNGETPYH